ncbi:hypothetical protein HU200_034143 [Digitaria exilis]|uniref:Uncharacterized protein n=1 Tax=Digitaria exilis TaxID=1010633 RepID=A0A835BK94_9POAL|nr:hypothetical protein HU200_034143 [Digitaria exilis]
MLHPRPLTPPQAAQSSPGVRVSWRYLLELRRTPTLTHLATLTVWTTSAVFPMIYLLIQVLVRLLCARAAAHTSLISRRWRGLWRYIPELYFRDITPGALDTGLSQVARGQLCLLDIDVPDGHSDCDIPVEVPIFERATSIKLEVANLSLVPPAQGGDFTVLEKLSVSGCRVDNGFLVSQCTCLRVLDLFRCWGHDIIMD